MSEMRTAGSYERMQNVGNRGTPTRAGWRSSDELAQDYTTRSKNTPTCAKAMDLSVRS